MMFQRSVPEFTLVDGDAFIFSYTTEFWVFFPFGICHFREIIESEVNFFLVRALILVHYNDQWEEN